jgi:hypothetical protein
MKKILTAGAVDQTLDVFVQDSSVATGAGLTGLVFNTASLVCYYRKGATGSATALTLVTQTVGGAHSDGGFVAIDGTNMPGMYRLDLSDTIVASAGSVVLMLKGATNMAPLTIELQLDAPVNVAQWLGTACATPTVAGVPEVDLTHVAGATTNVAALATNVDAILTDTGTTLQGELDGIQADTEDIQARIPAALVSGRIDASVGAMAANVMTAAAAAADLTTEFQTGLATAADLATVDSVVDAILLDTAEIGAAGAGLTALASQASVTTIDDFLDTEIAAILAAVDTEVAAILALLDDPRGEPGQGSPAVNPDAMTKIDYLYKAWRNRSTQTASEYALYADDGTTKDQEAAVSDDGTTFVRSEIVTGL